MRRHAEIVSTAEQGRASVGGPQVHLQVKELGACDVVVMQKVMVRLSHCIDNASTAL